MLWHAARTVISLPHRCYVVVLLIQFVTVQNFVLEWRVIVLLISIHRPEHHALMGMGQLMLSALRVYAAVLPAVVRMCMGVVRRHARLPHWGVHSVHHSRVTSELVVVRRLIHLLWMDYNVDPVNNVMGPLDVLLPVHWTLKFPRARVVALELVLI